VLQYPDKTVGLGGPRRTLGGSAIRGDLDPIVKNPAEASRQLLTGCRDEFERLPTAFAVAGVSPIRALLPALAAKSALVLGIRIEG